jgi:eukaryotic-like serine/threonine-protein kinase
VELSHLRSRQRSALLATLLVIVGSVAGCGGGDEETVPSVVGDPVDAAVTTLSEAGFPVSVARTPSTEEAGSVVSQSPAADTSASEDTTVYLVVSAGQYDVTVPDVVGDPVEEATETVQAAGFVVGLVGKASTAELGSVYESQPAGNTSAPVGSTVQLLVSKGPASVDVPDVVGDKASDAIETLSSAGFVVTGQPVFSEEAKGNVVAQDPAAGVSEAKGASVWINISQGTGTVVVPSLKGLSADVAEQQLTQLGLTGVPSTVPASAPEGTVTAQDPAAGTTAKTGSEVNYNLSDASKTENVAMPSLLGLTRDAAQTQLNQLGLAYTVYVVPSDKKAGHVVAQDPKAGTSVEVGSTVHFNVAGGEDS